MGVPVYTTYMCAAFGIRSIGRVGSAISLLGLLRGLILARVLRRAAAVRFRFAGRNKKDRTEPAEPNRTKSNRTEPLN